MSKTKPQTSPALISAVRQNFADLRPGQFVCSFKSWYASQVAIHKLLISVGSTLLAETQGALANSAARNRTMVRMIEQLQSRFQFPEESYCDFSAFGYKRSKKAGNLRRVVSENNDMVDYLNNFREEGVELADTLFETEKLAKKKSMELIDEAAFQARDEKIRAMILQAKNLLKPIESESVGLQNKYSSVLNIFSANLEPVFKVSKLTGIPETSKRNTLAILSVFAYYCQRVTTAVRNFALTALHVLNKAKHFEIENMQIIKSAIQAFGSEFDQALGQKEISVLKKTAPILAKFDPKKTAEEMFKPELILSFEDLEGIKKLFYVDSVDEIFLQKFIKETTQDSSGRFTGMLCMKVWKGLVVENNGIPFQAIIKLTREGTFAVYHFNFAKNEQQLYKTIFLENTGIEPSVDPLQLKMCYIDHAQPKAGTQVITFVLDEVTKNEISAFLGQGSLILEAPAPPKREEPKTNTSTLGPESETISMKSEKTSETLEDNTLLSSQLDILKPGDLSFRQDSSFLPG